jgi:alkaline phosphatase D
VTRRELAVAATVAGAYALVPPAFARVLKPGAVQGPGRFLDGVASGEPSHDAVTFWSRLTTDRPVSGARLVVCEDEGLTRTVAQVVVPTSRSVDGALKTRIDGLQPGRHYWYAWQSADDVSPTGRTKTAPAPDSRVPLTIGFSSCQKYSEGFFNAHRDAAADDLDLYVFLGDYTYEYEEPEPTVAGRADFASVDLRTYRSKLRMYRQDADLRELHRLHPIVHIWDDHEVADDYSDNDPTPSLQQRNAGFRASFEWLPRMALPSDRLRIFRTLPLGRAAELFLLDERQYRTGDNDGNATKTILGRRQMDWLKQALIASRSDWKLVGNQVMFMPLGVAGIPVNADQWDGYPDDRTELEQLIDAAALQDVVFLTGDIHLYAAGNAYLGAKSVATEYVGGSVTSAGVPAELEGLDSVAVRAVNPHLRYFNGTRHGWARAAIDGGELKVQYRTSDITVQGAPSATIASFTQTAGTNEVVADAGLLATAERITGRPAAVRRGSALAARQARYAKAVRRDLERRAR